MMNINKRPNNDAPAWRWKIYSFLGGYSFSGGLVRALVRDVPIGLAESWRGFWRWAPATVAIAEIIKVVVL